MVVGFRVCMTMSTKMERGGRVEEEKLHGNNEELLMLLESLSRDTKWGRGSGRTSVN